MPERSLEGKSAIVTGASRKRSRARAPPQGVRVNAIAPGVIETKLSEYFWKGEGKQEALLDRQPIQHLGQPCEVADVALLLASDRGSYITGRTLVVDGGRTLP